jgi:hypothetical protein
MATAVASPIFHPIVAPYPKFLCSMANEILSSGIHIKVGKAGFGIRVAAGLWWAVAHHRAITRGKTEVGETPSLLPSYPLKIAILELPRLERVPIQEKSHVLPQRE